MWWGLGLGLEMARSNPCFLHWGANPGYSAIAMGSRQTGTALVMLTNAIQGLETGEAVATAVSPAAILCFD